jgi:hypothetical protein
MGKQPSSTTQNTFPPWLSAALNPLISNATKNMGQFGAQGFNVLQGQPYNTGDAANAVNRFRGAGKLIDPEAINNISAVAPKKLKKGK